MTFAGKYRSLAFTPVDVPRTAVTEQTYTRSTPKLPSKMTPGAHTSTPPTRQYTGSKMLGIGTLHKSNSVPVFSSDEAIEIARMRRG